LQIDQRRNIDARRTEHHSGAKQRIEHPASYGRNNAGRTLHAQKLARGPLLNAAHQNPMAEIGVPPIMNFGFLSDTGRMNG
jgi:hypothetical protein